MSGVPSILNRARPEIRSMKPYLSARKLVENKGDGIYLDANELSCEPLAGFSGLNRYADQQPNEIIDALADLYGVALDEILVSRGADEAIDIIVRTFCVARKDNVVICPPTFPVYAFAAQIQDIGVRQAPLSQDDFSMDIDSIRQQVDANTKLIFVCSPNNPTASCVPIDKIEKLCERYTDQAVIVVDETYIEFTGQDSATKFLPSYPNLIVLRTLSKAYGLAGVRCGCLIANSAVTELCRRTLQIYPIPVPVLTIVMKMLQPENRARLNAVRRAIIERRDRFMESFRGLTDVVRVYPSQANFVLVKFKNAADVMRRCSEAGIFLRDQSGQLGLKDCIRIAIGSEEEMAALLGVLRHKSP